MLRFLLVEAAQVTQRSDSGWVGKFFPLAMRRGRKIAKVRHGPEAGGSFVLDDAQGMRLWAVDKISLDTRESSDIAMV